MALQTIKTGTNFKIMREGKDGPKLVLLRNVRLSFPAIGHPKDEENDDGKTSRAYKATGMLPKETHEEAKVALVSIIKELIAENEAKVPSDKWFLKDGDDSEREEYADHWIITASDKKVRPIARDADGERMYVEADYENREEREEALDKIDETFFAGAIVDLLVRPWFFGGKVKGQTKTFPKRISCGLGAIKFVKDDGTRFSKGQIDDDSVWDDGDDDNRSSKSKQKSKQSRSSMDDDDDEL